MDKKKARVRRWWWWWTEDRGIFITEPVCVPLSRSDRNLEHLEIDIPTAPHMRGDQETGFVKWRQLSSVAFDSYQEATRNWSVTTSTQHFIWGDLLHCRGGTGIFRCSFMFRNRGKFCFFVKKFVWPPVHRGLKIMTILGNFGDLEALGENRCLDHTGHILGIVSP